jgi:hypothetical protein
LDKNVGKLGLAGKLMKCVGARQKNFKNFESCPEWFSIIFLIAFSSALQQYSRSKKIQKYRWKVYEKNWFIFLL